jgi:chromosome segregation ATPase
MKDNSRLNKMWESIKKMLKKARELVCKLIITIKRKINKVGMGCITVPKELNKKYDDIQKYYHENIALDYSRIMMSSLKHQNEGMDGFKELDESLIELEKRVKDLKSTEISSSDTDERLNHSFYRMLDELNKDIDHFEKEITESQNSMNEAQNKYKDNDENERYLKSMITAKSDIMRCNKQIRAANFVIDATSFMISVCKDKPKEKAEESFIEWYHNMCIAD